MLIEYLPPTLSRIKEMRAITDAEQPEFDEIDTAIDRIVSNVYILLADESGIAKFEEILGITPSPGADLEERRLNVLSKNSKSKVTTAVIKSIVSNYTAAVEIIKNFDNDELILVLNADAGSLQTIYEILDEKIPLNIFYDFLLQRTYDIGIEISSKIYEMYERAAGNKESCGNTNQITKITETACDVCVSGFCNISPVTAAGVIACGAEFGEITTSPVFVMAGVNVEIDQTHSASNTPFALSGEEYAGKEV